MDAVIEVLMEMMRDPDGALRGNDMGDALATRCSSL